VLVVRWVCLHFFFVNLSARESDTVSLLLLFFLDSESQVGTDLTDVSFLHELFVGECCNVWNHGDKVLKVVERRFPPPLGLEDPFQGQCEEVEYGWRCATAEWEQLVTPCCTQLAEC